jgi:flagellar biosynthesis chaperone FliJ
MALSARDAEINALKTIVADNNVAYTHLQMIVKEQSDNGERLVRDLEGKITRAQDKTTAAEEQASSLQAMIYEL